MSLRSRLLSRPTAVYSFRYEREDGEFRTIDVSAPTMEEAREIADRRLNEQYGDMCLLLEEQRRQQDKTIVDLGADRIRNRPDLHQDNYTFVSVERVR